MAGFTTTDDGWMFSFEDPVTKPSLPTEPTRATGYLEGEGKWENYSDLVLYELESLMRQLFEQKLDDFKWKQQNPKWRRYTCGMMFEVIYGRKADLKSSDDQVRLRRLPKLMTYYSTRKQKEGSINGKKMTKTIYTLSLKRYKSLPPYSLRLRLEWLEEQGRVPCWQNMKLPKDNLEVGHARNPKTDANMEKRRQRARERYNERYKDRDH